MTVTHSNVGTEPGLSASFSLPGLFAPHRFNTLCDCANKALSLNLLSPSLLRIKFSAIKLAKSLSCKGKITKKGLHGPFFLTIVGASGEKWSFVGNC
jgi:hypothetical protein